MNAVIYARYSSDSQREESIEGQLRECTEYAEKNDMTVIEHYIDRAFSARTADRPDFQRMIKDSEKHTFEVIIVWKLDRFARDRYDSAYYKKILRKNGVKVISATERIAEGSVGILVESIIEGYAEFYSAELSEKIRRGQKDNALKGKTNGGGVPLGYRLNAEQRLEINPDTAPVVAEIFERYASGETKKEIADDLNARGIKTKTGKRFVESSFNKMLSNRKYIGEFQYKDVVIPDCVPPIVSEELFETVQQRIAKNHRAPGRFKAKEEYLLTTKLFCGKCESMMVGESGTSKTGAKHYYYKCASAKRKRGCDKKAIKKDYIENLVVEETVKRVFRDDVIAQIADEIMEMQEQPDAALLALKKQLEETNQGIENFLHAIQQGIITDSTKQRLCTLEAEKAELQKAILSEELSKTVFTREKIISYINKFRYGDRSSVEYKRNIIDHFVNAVYLFDDYLILLFNCKGGSKRIPLSTANKTFGSDVDSLSPPENRSSRFGCSGFFIEGDRKAVKKTLRGSVVNDDGIGVRRLARRFFG